MFADEDEWKAALKANRGQVPRSTAQRRVDHAAFDRMVAEASGRKQHEAGVGRLRGWLDQCLKERVTKARYQRVKPNELSAETKRAYALDWGAFAAFCAEEAVHALPADDEIVAAFLFHVYASDGFKPAAAARALAAIRSKHDLAGFTPPDGPHIDAVREWFNQEDVKPEDGNENGEENNDV